MSVTFEEACRCPKCGQPGASTKQITHPSGTTIFTVLCENSLCLWYNTGWLVQRNRDGSIPERERGPRGADKDFVPYTPEQEAYARRVLEDTQQRDLRQD